MTVKVTPRRELAVERDEGLLRLTRLEGGQLLVTVAAAGGVLAASGVVAEMVIEPHEERHVAAFLRP